MGERHGSTTAANAAALLVAIALITVLTMLLPSDGSSPTPGPSTDPAGHEPDPERASALVVKIDNVAEARPHTGLDKADVVYVEPVESGLTRLVAVYTGQLPEVIGPVRSARESDIELLAQYDSPVLAYSGIAPELSQQLASSAIVPAGPRQAPGAYFRDPARPNPHNLYVRPVQLPNPPDGVGPVSSSEPGPDAGEPTPSRQVSFDAARYEFAWSSTARRWQVSMDGTPLRSTDSGAISAATVLIQHVAVRDGEVGDATNAPSPVVTSVGTGAATVLRDGKAIDGTWQRDDPSATTTLRTSTGDRIPFGPGPVWVLLVPQ